MRDNSKLVRRYTLSPHGQISNALHVCSRRDGSPFLNLLVIAPLYDSSGKVRFFLGAQVDVNGLFEDGRGLESLARLLQQDKTGAQSETIHSSKPLDAFAGLGRLLNDKERSVIHASHTNGASPQSHAMLARETSNGADSDEDICCSAAQLSLSTSGPNGRLVGVFQNVRNAALFPCLVFIIRHGYLQLGAKRSPIVPTRFTGTCTPHRLRLSIAQFAHPYQRTALEPHSWASKITPEYR